MSWQVVPDAEVSKVIAASQEGRCVACYGSISQDCPSQHGFYCCGCDDMECDVRAELCPHQAAKNLLARFT